MSRFSINNNSNTMSGNSIGSNGRSQPLHCKICNDLLYEPKHLPCGHSFCTDCLYDNDLVYEFNEYQTCYWCKSCSRAVMEDVRVSKQTQLPSSNTIIDSYHNRPGGSRRSFMTILGNHRYNRYDEEDDGGDEDGYCYDYDDDDNDDDEEDDDGYGDYDHYYDDNDDDTDDDDEDVIFLEYDLDIRQDDEVYWSDEDDDYDSGSSDDQIWR